MFQSNKENIDEKGNIFQFAKKFKNLTLDKKDNIEKETPENSYQDEYEKDVFECYKTNEIKYRIPEDFLQNQEYVDSNIRGILVDWLIDYHYRCKLNNESLHLAIQLADRYMLKRSLERSMIQVVYIACLRLACKYTELNPIRGISSNSFTKQDVIEMESNLLEFFEYNITHYSTVHHFLKKSDVKQVHFYAELSLIYSDSYKFLPSEIAKACLSLGTKESVSDCPKEAIELLQDYTTRLSKSKLGALIKKYQ